ncbi:hypothetical protein CXF85_09685 [Colwellia sp. 75C3]|uniref:TonB-dependent receptor plug domain-containing protein n=1 Tax=Colwellia sp. 75C3 TaxID=888425 RepID=UPI000C328DDB|nr:TonB-dependent receptor plug domain-containing protein [Colwellia sp. 75C3]PKG83768.1 hypothetical protein CXF85_09685 [Colwellia sp. 75C3]
MKFTKNPSIPKIKFFRLLGYTFASILSFNSILAIANDSVSASSEMSLVPDSSEYPAAFFEQYTPQNAMDMINRLPGFSFDRGSNARGFGGNAGNVLIDGARPTSKSGGLTGALTRISAAQVESIVILRGGVAAGDAAGQSVVANIIRVKGLQQGTWAAKLRRAPDNTYLPNLEAAMSTTIADWETSFDIDIGGSPGYRTALIENFDANNSLTSSADEEFSDSGRWIFINGEGASQFSSGQLVINSRIGGDKWRGDTQRDVFNNRLPDTSTPDEFWQLNENNKFKMAELGIDWTQKIESWKWHIIGLGLVNDRNYHYNFHEEIRSPLEVSDNYFSQNRLKTEVIARTTLGKISNAAFKPEFGFEIANNRLNTNANETENGVLVPVEGANVVVEEWRGEFFATFSYEVDAKFTLEGGLTAEFSQISVSGDTDQTQKFDFIKPRLSATYKVNSNNTLTLEGEHSVGQLNFNDFASSTEASDDSSTLGNPDLQPDQQTEIAATYDWSFSERGSLKVKAFYQWRSDILEQIILETNGDEISQGLGNAGDARFWGFITELNLPLDYILPNALLEVSYKYNDSQFYDSIISADRIINDYTPNWTTFKFRQDFIIEKFAWGAEYWGDFIDTNYRVDEIQTFGGNKRVRLFIETTRFFDLKTQLEVTHLNTGRYTRSRYFYQKDRSGEFDGSEISHRQRGPELKFSIWGTF